MECRQVARDLVVADLVVTLLSPCLYYSSIHRRLCAVCHCCREISAYAYAGCVADDRPHFQVSSVDRNFALVTRCHVIVQARTLRCRVRAARRIAKILSTPSRMVTFKNRALCKFNKHMVGSWLARGRPDSTRLQIGVVVVAGSWST